MRENAVPAGLVVGVTVRKQTGLAGVGVFVVPAGHTRSPDSVLSVALVQSGSGFAPPKSILPSPSLSMVSEHCARAALSSLVSVALVQPGSAGKSIFVSQSLSIPSAHCAVVGEVTH